MNKDIKARWVAALRAPEARQTSDVLGTADGARCCLGVLCDLAVADGIIDPPVVEHLSGGLSGRLYYDGTWSTLPTAVYRWAGLISDNPYVVTAGVGDSLSNYNDNGHTFPQIADMIEQAEDL